MSVIGSNILAGASGQGGGYNLSRSLRFRSSASAYLNRTFSATRTSDKIMTFSTWLKRGGLGSTTYHLFGGYDGSSAATTGLAFSQDSNTDKITFQFGGSSGALLATTQVFRDPSAWYHIVLAIDTTQATSADRVKLYVNGVQVTSFSTTNYPSQNATYQFLLNNSNNAIGRFGNGNINHFDGYMAETHCIDGQALTPSSFGEYSTTTGVWQPKKYAGTYGTNGFYLDFKDNTSTTTLGYDKSGNSNNWTTNNISLTTGSTYDSMTDVPTLTSATTSNFAVLNPLSKAYSTYTISDGNLGWTSSTVNMGAFSTIQLPTSGKYYWEIVMTASAGGSPQIGVGGGTAGLGDLGAYYRTNGNKGQYGGVSGNGESAYGATWTTNDVIGVAYDADTSSGQVTFYKNNSSQGVAFSSLLTNFPNGLFAAFQNNASGTTNFVANFGQRPFAYTPPTGFVALNTFNLPTPTIGATASTQANKYFDILLYTGNGGTQTITGLNFQPDLVWGKARNDAVSHNLFDIVRGGDRQLVSNSTNAEVDRAGDAVVFNSNGITLDASYCNINNTSTTTVAWNWKANGTGVTNTAGSITSTVSANTTSGFSIVSYTAPSGGGPFTVGHGLGVAPSMIIVKCRDTSGDSWQVYHKSLGNTTSPRLNESSATYSGYDWWNSTSPTSTVFSLGTRDEVDRPNNKMIAYCWAEVAGYSKFTSYVGNGSSDGTFVYCGFSPRFIMVKRTTAASDWFIIDTARNTYNEAKTALFANASNADYTLTTGGFDIVSNGFKLRVGSGFNPNASGETYIVAAFSEHPFKYALAR